MSKRSSSAKLDLDEIPVFYADQAAGLMLGAHVSRITFGVESEDDDNEYPRPVVTVAIQTDSLIDLVSDLKMILDSEKFKADMNKRLERSMLKINNGVKANPSDFVKELLLERELFEDAEVQLETSPKKKSVAKKN